MTTIAGMDLGYGSQVKIVRTNYLVALDASGATVTGAANLLALVQGNSWANQASFDYVIASAGITSTTDPSVLLTLLSTDCPAGWTKPWFSPSSFGHSKGNWSNCQRCLHRWLSKRRCSIGS